MKKYELTNETIEFRGRKLYRIRALKDFRDVVAGDLGGYIESEENLSEEGLCWVYNDARVCDNAQVYNDARVCDNAQVCDNTDYACISGFGRVQRTTTFFRTVDGAIGVTCGCFTGRLDEFRAKVRETHGDSKFAKEYLMIVDLMEMHFRESECH